jgi:hypothetical protein
MRVSLYTVNILLIVLVSVIFSACSVKELQPVVVKSQNKEIDYSRDIKPILDSRCVVCHSCYNSPCQAKFSSYEGVDRGASKIKVYNATRLRAIDPTRLFVDAQSTQEWRTKGFYSLTESLDTNESTNDSIMIHMLTQKMKNPKIIGDYAPETDTLTCPRDKDEVNEYFTKKPNHGMPYGMPALKQAEYETLASWLHAGAKGPEKKKTVLDKKIKNKIKLWDEFLNKEDAKHSVTARYLYEHLFLAHLNFESAPKDFYSLVRSKTPYPQEVDVIATTRPFDDPKVEKFYYRFVKINSTIVHKTHMVFKLNDKKLERFKELFIKPKWEENPHFVDYERISSANPFVKFKQIPARSRYQFLLDNAHYTVMTFIRGPVCRGQIALNVIHDHFWVAFMDPDYDLSVKYPEFLNREVKNLEMPIETVNKSVLEVFSDKYRDKYEKYYKDKQNFYDIVYKDGLGIESIWKGNVPEDSPMLTVYRHFDSASVHKGALGQLPRTAWVIDYPQFERIYYSLVAGYDVFGNVSHQSNIRRYMDFLRIEGEANFLSYMPKNARLDMFKSWYIGDDEIQNLKENTFQRGTKVVYETKDYKREFLENIINNHLLKSTNIKLDDLNYYTRTNTPKMPKELKNEKDIKQAFRSLTAPSRSFVKNMEETDVNVILLRIKIPQTDDFVLSIVINKWHDNVNSLWGESKRLNNKKDTLDFIEGSVGSYPNMFAVVEYNDLADFFDLMQKFDFTEKYMDKIKKYLVSRDDKRFWETYDWFQEYFNKSNPTEAGLYDLNRYYKSTF